MMLLIRDETLHQLLLKIGNFNRGDLYKCGKIVGHSDVKMTKSYPKL
ncbi:MAG: hypothetical protein ACREBG_01555 [Pyrinomonadaceae bacterium]